MHNGHQRTTVGLNTLSYTPKQKNIMCGHPRVSSTMLSPLVSWILSSPSSSSSSSTEAEEEEEQSLDVNDNTTDESDHENDNAVIYHDQDNDQNHTPNNDDENDHYLSSCDVDDTIPMALAVPEAPPTVTVAFPAADERNIVATAAATTIATRSKRQRTTNYSGVVRQYQRLWTKQDEIELLKGYLDYVKKNKDATSSLQNDVALFYDDVRHKLNAGFNKNQLVEKLRRLKRKHKMALDKGNLGKEVTFKSPPDEAIFEISNKIWGNDTNQDDALDGGGGGSGGGGGNDLGKVKAKTEQVDNCDEIEKRAPKRSRLSEHGYGDDAAATADIQGFIEETMRSCFSPLMKEMLDDAQEGLLGGLAPKPVEFCPGEAGYEQWRKQRISELEVYLNRLELLQDQIKAKLEELRSG